MTSSTNHIKPSVKEIREKKNTILSIKRSQTTEEEYFRIYNRICDHVSQQKDGGYQGHIDFQSYIDNRNRQRTNPTDSNVKPKDPLCRPTVYAYKAVLLQQPEIW